MPLEYSLCNKHPNKDKKSKQTKNLFQRLLKTIIPEPERSAPLGTSEGPLPIYSRINNAMTIKLGRRVVFFINISFLL